MTKKLAIPNGCSTRIRQSWQGGGCGGGAKAGTPTGPQAFPVKTMTAQAETVPISTDYLATLRSRNAATLQPLVEGDITKIFVNSGDRVQAGAPIWKSTHEAGGDGQ